MAIPKSTSPGLASIIVIIALTLSQTAAQAVYPNALVTTNDVSKSIKPDNTVRVDPLDHLKKYRGGFDITNKHYWGSVIFTGIYGYAIGVLWLVCGLFWVIINFCCQSHGGRRIKKILHFNHKSCDFSPTPLSILFIILTMVASVFVYVGSAKFHSHARTSVNVIFKIADDASGIIHNATRALEDIQEDLVESNISSEVSENLNTVAMKFDNAVYSIVKKTRKKKHIVNKAFKVVFIITIVITSLNLVAAPILLVLGVHMFWKAFYLFLIISWLMTVICWQIFGLYFFLENFSNDTCTVLYTFEENPYNNSLTSILPCDELRSANTILHDIGSAISILVSEVNSNVGPLFPNHVYLCNPFSAPPQYSYQPQFCPPGSIQIGDIPKVLKPYTCFDDNDEKCARDDLMDGGEYEVVESYASSIQNLLNMYPSMEQLIGCQLVKDAFSEVLLNHCKPFKRYSRMAWVGMVFIAIVMVFFVVLWTIKAGQEHSFHVSDGSV